MQAFFILAGDDSWNDGDGRLGKVGLLVVGFGWFDGIDGCVCLLTRRLYKHDTYSLRIADYSKIISYALPCLALLRRYYSWYLFPAFFLSAMLRVGTAGVRSR